MTRIKNSSDFNFALNFFRVQNVLPIERSLVSGCKKKGRELDRLHNYLEGGLVLLFVLNLAIAGLLITVVYIEVRRFTHLLALQQRQQESLEATNAPSLSVVLKR